MNSRNIFHDLPTLKAQSSPGNRQWKPRGHHNPSQHSSGRQPGRWDVVNRPAGDRRVTINTDVDTLIELIIGFSFLNNQNKGVEPDERDVARLQNALSDLLAGTRTKFKGRHPNDISAAEILGSDRQTTLIDLLSKMRDLVG